MYHFCLPISTWYLFKKKTVLISFKALKLGIKILYYWVCKTSNFFMLIFCFETGSLYVVLAGLELAM